MANILLGMVMYSHSRSEDMLVHHRDVATPRDPVTARMGEHFYRYFPQILNSSFC
jgi:alkane 1-monooxygenase